MRLKIEKQRTVSGPLDIPERDVVGSCGILRYPSRGFGVIGEVLTDSSDTLSGLTNFTGRKHDDIPHGREFNQLGKIK